MSGRAVLLSARARRAAAKEDQLTGEYANAGPSVCQAAAARVDFALSAALLATTRTKGELNG